MYLLQSLFENNTGTIEGGVIKITGMIVKSFNCTFINNTSPYGNNIAAYPVKIALNSSNKLKNLSNLPPISYFIDEQVTGSPMTILLYLNILDYYNQIVSTLVNEIAQISLSDFNKTSIKVKDYSFVGKEYSIIQQGQFSYDNITFYSDPADSILTLRFTSDKILFNFLKYESETKLMNLSNIQEELRPDLSLNYGDSNISNAYFYLIDVKMRKCIAGEIYNNVSKSCSSCSYKTYSFNPNDTSCTDCPENAVCIGGNSMLVNPGFWRSGNQSINIHACIPFSPSCL